MNADPKIAVESGMAIPAAHRPGARVGAGVVVRLGIWIGLIAGFCDAGFLVMNKRLIDRDFYHVGDDFPWVIPTAVMVLVLVPTLFFALHARIRGPIRLGGPLLVLSFLGYLDVFARLRLEMWAAVIVGGGLAIQSVRFVRPRTSGFLRLVSWTVGWLVATLVAIMVLTIGPRVWSKTRHGSVVPPPAPGAQNVLLVVWDTVRAGNTSLYGYHRRTTPNLERLASRGVRFDLAFSTSSWTLPSHASILTGRWPHELGVDWKTPVRDGVPTLAGYLGSRGYDTAGFVANVDYCSRETGLARGFTHYEDFPWSLVEIFTRYVALGRRIEVASWASFIDARAQNLTGRWHDLFPRSREHMKSADAINGAFLGWLRKRSSPERPFFAFLNFNDAHTPYEVPEPAIPGFGLRPASSSERQTLRAFTGLDKTALSFEDVRMANDVYDDCISYLDRRLGMLLDELSRRGVLENTLVIVTSDHGEHLGDHRLFFHGCSLYRQLVQVPLVIVGKNGIPAGRTVAEAVSLCDLPTTVIDLLGLGPDHPFAGRSVARWWQPRAQPGARVVPEPLLVETTKPQFLTNDGREPAAKGPMKAVVAAGMHYIRMADGLEELYNLSSDVEEKDNLVRDGGTSPVLLQFRNLLGLLLKKR